MKKLAFATLALLAACLVIEVAARLLFAARVGPSVLLYGTPLERAQAEDVLASPEERAKREQRREIDRKHTVMVHANQQRNYSKYFPNQKRSDYDQITGERFDVTINSMGFRGAEFTHRKAPGVVRILTLGASSTFGYYSRDHETYPVQLQQQLEARCRDTQRYEVINLGIPHLDSGSIAALFVAEGLALHPDVVTFYEGVNDTSAMKQRLDLEAQANESPGSQLAAAAGAALAEHLISVGFLRSLLSDDSAKFSKATFDRNVGELSQRFLQHLEIIAEGCRRGGCDLLFASQQATSTKLSPQELSVTPYGREVELLSERAMSTQRITTSELRLLTHSVLMEELEQWVSTRGLGWIDVASALDEHREVLLSWVHLSPKGNRIVAETLSDEILRRTCTDIAAGRATQRASTGENER